MTTFTVLLFPKQMEMIHRIVPNAAVIAVLVNPDDQALLPAPADLENAARANGMKLLLLNAATPEEIDAAFTTITNRHADALLVTAEPFLTGRSGQIATLAVRHAVPTIDPWRVFPAAGGLMSYGTDLGDGYRQAGAYAARILKGEKPGDLPVQQPTKFELVINTTTAKALGLAIPPTLLAVADEVIE